MMSGNADSERVEVVLFKAESSPVLVRAIWLLAAGLVLPPESIAALATRVWAEQPPGVNEVRGLLEWPFVREEQQGYRLEEAVRAAFLRDFERHDSAGFLAAHRALVRQEQEQELGQAGDEAWFTRGRIAHYLAGVDARESARHFESVFSDRDGDAPMDRVAARMWLTALVLRQESLLDDVARDVAFYRAFRHYVTGQTRQARDAFETVLAFPSVDDSVTAIAEHLLGVLVVREDPTRAGQLFSCSVDRSKRIGLDANRIMAANSLAWVEVSEARRLRDGDLLRRAATLSASNAAAAESVGESYLVSWTRLAALSIEWLAITDDGRNASSGYDDADRLLAGLAKLERSARETQDAELLGQAANAAAGMLRDLGQYRAALDVVERTLREITRLDQTSPRVMEKLAKTTGSIRGVATSRDARARANATLDKINALILEPDGDGVSRSSLLEVARGF